MFKLEQMVSEPTHRQGHVLDWVIERPDEQVHKISTVSDCLESDHLCVISLFVIVDINVTVHRFVRNLRC